MELSPNFRFLEQRFPDVAESATLAERNVYRDSRGACFHARHALERLVIRIFKFDKSLSTPDSQNLYGYMHDHRWPKCRSDEVCKISFFQVQGIQPLQVGKLPKKIMLEQLLPMVLQMEHGLEAYKTGDKSMLLWSALNDGQTQSYKQAYAALLSSVCKAE